jgi:hypothetical protein
MLHFCVSNAQAFNSKLQSDRIEMRTFLDRIEMRVFFQKRTGAPGSSGRRPPFPNAGKINPERTAAFELLDRTVRILIVSGAELNFACVSMGAIAILN